MDIKEKIVNMSTKYFGYRLKNTSVVNVFNQLKNSKQLFIDVLTNQIKQDFVEYMFYRLDQSIITDQKNITQSTIFGLKCDFLSEKNHQIYNIDVCMFPYGHDTLIMDCGDFLYTDTIKSFGWEDYSYWNNTDKPKDISNREWNHRLKVWDKLCPSCPADNSIRFKPAYNNIVDCDLLHWKYNDLKSFIEKSRPIDRIKMYNKNCDFYNKITKNNKISDFKFVTSNQMIDITEHNFDQTFDVIKVKKR